MVAGTGREAYLEIPVILSFWLGALNTTKHPLVYLRATCLEEGHTGQWRALGKHSTARM